MSSGGTKIERTLKTINEEIKNCNSSFRSASKSAQELSKLLKLDPKNVKLTAAYYEKVQAAVDACKKKIELLREQQRLMVEKNGDVAKNTQQYKDLEVEIEKTTVKMNNLSTSIEKASNQNVQFTDTFQKNLKTVQVIYQGVQQAISNVANTYKTVIGGIINVAKQYAETAEEIAKASQKYGMTAEEYQFQVNRWERLTGEAGAYESVLASLQSLSASAELENTKLGKVLERLGLTFDDLTSMNPAETLEIYLQALRECEDETERTNLATRLFGSSIGPWMATMAMTGNDQLAEWDRWLEEAGYLTDEQVAKGEQLQDTFEKLQQTIKSVIADAGEDLIDLTKSLISLFTNLIPLIKGVAQFFAAIGPSGTMAVTAIMAMLSVIPPLVVMLAALNASAKQYVAAFTALAILGTVAAVGGAALVAGSGYGASDVQVDDNMIQEIEDMASGSDIVTSYNESSSDSHNVTYVDNSTNNYEINNQSDVDEIIEQISDARRGIIGG